MEHRWSIRKPVMGSIVVECPRVGLVRATMRDVSLSGMFVDTGATVLPLNAPVSVVFNLSSDKREIDYCLQAMIVRRTPNGVGIMFLDPDPDVMRAMRNALYDEVSAAPSRRPNAISVGQGQAMLGSLPYK